MSYPAGLDHAAERLLLRDRAVVLAGLVLVALLAWIYLIYLALAMDTAMPAAGGGLHGASELMRLAPWSLGDGVLMLLMWSVMMVAMMLPSATPMILLYARVLRRNAGHARPLVPTAAFLAGYLAVWIAFSVAATVLQWLLERVALLSPMMVSSSAALGALLLLAAAVYQWTPGKDACLKRCRSPVWFLSSIWRDGTGGAFKMGLEHGAYCLGCCWALMLLLFVGGVMNLLCIAAITVFVLLEKLAPRGRAIGRLGALLFAAAGVYLLAA